MAHYLPDVNILIHALRQNSPVHTPCRRWLEECTANGDSLYYCELIEVAFIRICTLPRLSIAPMPIVLSFWERYRDYPFCSRLVPNTNHAHLFKSYIERLNLVGNDVNDAWLAALAVDHQVTLVSPDIGFSRFLGLNWVNPI